MDGGQAGLTADARRRGGTLPWLRRPTVVRGEDVVIMLVVQVRRFGGPEVLTARQAPDPVAGPGQVVVRTAAADVLFIDTAIRSGRGVDFFPIRPPYVPGNGVSGHAATGADRIRPVIGQRFPLARAADAHAALQARTAIAKTLLFPDRGTAGPEGSS